MTTAVKSHRTIAILTVLALWTGLFGLAGPEAAMGQANNYATHGCRYQPELINPISYSFDQVYYRNVSAMNSGVVRWNNTSAPGYFSQATYFDPEINIFDTYYGYGWAASVEILCLNGYYYLDEVDLHFNLDFIWDFTASQWGTIAAHELGHVYGLDHVSGCTLMVRTTHELLNECGLSGPTQSDINGVHSIY